MDDDGAWDAAFAADLLGGTLLVGLTYLDADGEISGRRQVFGEVVRCDPHQGIAVMVDGADEPFVIAPILSAISVADPGIYRLRDDDAAIENPDFLATFTVRAPRKS